MTKPGGDAPSRSEREADLRQLADTVEVEPKDFRGLRVVNARVVRWDSEHGVAVDYEVPPGMWLELV